MNLESSTEASVGRGTPGVNSQLESPSPRRISIVLLVAIAGGVCDRLYWFYSKLDHQQPDYWMPYIQGSGSAPEQYRVGVKFAAWWMVRHFHWSFRHGFTLMDVLTSVLGTLLIYDILQHKPWYNAVSNELRWLASCSFLLLVCFNLAWVESYFRPETLPTTGLVAFIAWLWTRREQKAATGLSQALISSGLIAASAVQAFIRTDVVCVFAAGTLIISLFAWDSGIALRRGMAIATSGACGVIGASVQLYLMKVKYPGATYGSIPILMIRHDLNQMLGFPPFLCFILPFAWTVARFRRPRAPVDAANKGILLASGLYFVLWAVFGKLDEVRIFVPFALALAPLTVELLVRRVRGEAAGTLHRAGAQL